MVENLIIIAKKKKEYVCCSDWDPYFSQRHPDVRKVNPRLTWVLVVCGIGCFLSVYVGYIAIYLYILQLFLTLTASVSSVAHRKNTFSLLMLACIALVLQHIFCIVGAIARSLILLSCMHHIMLYFAFCSHIASPEH